MPHAQRYAVNHLDPQAFAAGLRPYARYRDLGIAAATGGLAVAHVIRFIPPCTAEARVWHTHAIDFQMIYVLQGWIVTEMEGREPETMRVGSAWLQPPNITHRVVDYSDDCEVLEVVLPANFETNLLGS